MTDSGNERRCHVEFCLEHSLSVSVRLHLFPSVTCPSTLFFYSSLSLSVASVLFRFRTILPFLSVSSFQPSTLGSDPTPVSSDLALYCFCHFLFGYNPYQPTCGSGPLRCMAVTSLNLFRNIFTVFSFCI